MGSLTATRAGVAKVAVTGVAAGALSGMFGVGGGILIVPALVLVLHFPQRLAHGTSLAAIIPIAISGLVGYALDGKVDWAVAFFLALGSATLGAVIGTHLLHVVSTRVLTFGFAALLVLTAVRLLADQGVAPGRHTLTVGLAVALVALGVVSGILAGMLGVGGGIVLIPAMVVLFGMPSAVAKGTSLAVILPTAIVGTVRNVGKGNADLRVAVIVGVSGMLAALAASQVSVRLDEQFSNRLFAALILVMAARLVYQELRHRPGEPPPPDPVGEA